MTDEGTATLVESEAETDTDPRFSGLTEEPESFSQAFLTSLDTAANLDPPTTTGGAPHLRTAWKRKQDPTRPIPGKPSARPAFPRGTARPVPGNVRAHLPGPDGLPETAPAVPPLPSLTRRAAEPGASSPRHAPLHAAAYPAGANPKAKPRGTVNGRGERAPSGTIVAGADSRRGWTKVKVQQWLGTALIIGGVLIAVGAFGGNYLMQRHTESENASFAASLSQFGPTPTPLTARATQVAARGSVNAGGGAAIRPSAAGAPGGGANAAILPLPATQGATAPAIGAGNSNGIDGAPVRTPAAPLSTPRPTAANAPGGQPGRGGPPPIVAGGGQPAARPQATAVQRPADTPSPRPPSANVAPPPLAPVQMPAPTAPPQPAPPEQPALNVDGMATAEPEPAPTPEPAPRMPQPSHVSIPALRVDSTVQEVGVSPTEIDGQEVYIWDVASYAVGHHFSSANPGEGENVVFSGHDDWQGEVFRDLYKLKKGDKIDVQAGDKTWSYHVDSVLLLQEIGVPLEQRLNNALYIGTTGDERLTLITCWPYGVDDHRLVVVAKPDWCTDC